MEEAYDVGLAEAADRDVTKIVAWWRAHRDASPEIFKRALDRALVQLPEQPAMGARVVFRRPRTVRRLTLLDGAYYVYYEVNDAKREVTVVHVRSTSRRRVHRKPMHRRGARAK